MTSISNPLQPGQWFTFHSDTATQEAYLKGITESQQAEDFAPAEQNQCFGILSKETESNGTTTYQLIDNHLNKWIWEQAPEETTYKLYSKNSSLIGTYKTVEVIQKETVYIKIQEIFQKNQQYLTPVFKRNSVPEIPTTEILISKNPESAKALKESIEQAVKTGIFNLKYLDALTKAFSTYPDFTYIEGFASVFPTFALLATYKEVAGMQTSELIDGFVEAFISHPSYVKEFASTAGLMFQSGILSKESWGALKACFKKHPEDVFDIVETIINLELFADSPQAWTLCAEDPTALLCFSKGIDLLRSQGNPADFQKNWKALFNVFKTSPSELRNFIAFYDNSSKERREMIFAVFIEELSFLENEPSTPFFTRIFNHIPRRTRSTLTIPDSLRVKGPTLAKASTNQISKFTDLAPDHSFNLQPKRFFPGNNLKPKNLNALKKRLFEKEAQPDSQSGTSLLSSSSNPAKAPLLTSAQPKTN